MRVRFEKLREVLECVLLKLGFEGDRAVLAARLFAEASRDGVASHGLNRFPRFVEMIKQGVVQVGARPINIAQFGAMEQWDGQHGPGNLNAHTCMDRAITLAGDHGIGCVALRNTNHWMRGGSYGWQAAEAGVIGICWTNTMPNLPAWGAREACVGNNPLIIAVPRPEGGVILDMAMSQFSYGTLEAYRLRGDMLPLEGGYDAEDRLTRDPAAIEATERPLPIGYWKGSGLAMMLDLVAALLSGGQTTHQIAGNPLYETGLSQVFLAFQLDHLHTPAAASRIVDEVVAYLHAATPVEPEGEVRYPGERTLRMRAESMEKGVPVDPDVWRQVKTMDNG